MSRHRNDRANLAILEVVIEILKRTDSKLGQERVKCRQGQTATPFMVHLGTGAKIDAKSIRNRRGQQSAKLSSEPCDTLAVIDDFPWVFPKGVRRCAQRLQLQLSLFYTRRAATPCNDDEDHNRQGDLLETT